MHITQTSTYQHLRQAIDEIPAVSAHDHLQRESDSVRMPTDLFHLMLSGMPFVDMVSAGIETVPGDGVMGDLGPFGQRDYDAIWKRRAPWIEHIQDTTEFRNYWRGVRELFDFREELCDSNWRELNQRIIAAQKPGRYREVLAERGKVRAILLERPWTWAETEEADRFYTCNVLPLTNWVDLAQGFRRNPPEDGQPLETLSSAVEALDSHLEKCMHEGIIALKLHQAYMRPLEFHEVPREVAEKDFPRPDHAGWTPRTVQDYMVNHIAKRAAELGLPLAFHAGYQLGNGNDIRNANAVLLTSLIRRHPRTRFDIFHLSYPYVEEALTMTKYFPNVTLNFTFADLLSTRKLVETLHLAIELLPSNKFFAWGADSGVVEATFGSLCTTRDAVARCLAERVEDGSLTRGRAIRLMHKLMHENAAEAYRIEEWWSSRPIAPGR